MIIESVIFFFWVFVVLVVGAIMALRTRRRGPKLQGVDSINPRLSFPQKNWLLLCIVVAIISPLLVSGITAVAHKKAYNESVERNSGTSPIADSTNLKDTSYHVATPPVH